MSLFANIFGIEQWLVILVIVFIIFGNRLPSVMRSLGQGVTEFKKGLEGTPDDSSAKRSEPSARIESQVVVEPAKKLDDQPVKS